MWFLYLLSWIALLFQVSLMTLAVGAALYYLAELIEEYTVATKKVLNGMLVASCVIYMGLWIIEGFPLTIIGFGLLTNIVGFHLLTSFPFIELTSPSFLLTCFLVFVNHYYAFQYFSEVYHTFPEVLAYFTLCLWAVPFTFFISLSAADNVLPQHMSYGGGAENDVLSHYMTKGKKKRSALLTVFENCKESLMGLGRQKRF